MFKGILTLVLTLSLFSVAAEAKVHHKKHKKLVAKSEVWCGAPNASEKYRFPYLAAIQTIKLKHGKKSEVVTVFEKGHVVFRDYVQKEYASSGLTYHSRYDDFALKFTPHAEKDSLAGFKAVIHDQDGVKLIENGEFQCHQS